jgi:Protein of unknown function (DUF3303)
VVRTKSRVTALFLGGRHKVRSFDDFLRNGSATENLAAQRQLLDLYSKWKPPAGTTFHQFVSRCDGAGAFSVVETDNPADLMDTASKFAAFVDYQIYPVVEIADGVQAAQEAASFVDSTS